jgi:CheY-like chemotaxis protein
MRGQGIVKAMRGETTLEEVLRVTQVDANELTRCAACSHGLTEDMVCCPWCGTSVAVNHCSGCSRRLDPEWRVCPWCRTPGASAALPVPHAEAAAKRLPRVLAVDDDHSVLAFVQAALAGDCEVLVADTAEEALRITAAEELDLVIVDLGLPDLAGLELARLLRGDIRTAVLPLLIMSGQEEHHVAGAAQHAGADGWLTKPVDPTMLLQKVLALVAS